MEKRKLKYLMLGLLAALCFMFAFFGIPERAEGQVSAEPQDILIITANKAEEYLNIEYGTDRAVLYGFKSGKIPTQEFILEIPADVDYIYANAFNASVQGKEGCVNMVGLILPARYSLDIGSNAFSGCINLMEIANGVETLVLSVTRAHASRITDYALNICTAVERMSIHKTDGYTFVYYQERSAEKQSPVWALVAYNGTEPNLTLPNRAPAHAGYQEGVFEIYNYAFRNKSFLKSISIPEGTTGIGVCAFDGCTKLESVTVPETVNSLGKNAFANCTGLKEFHGGAGLLSIGEYAFRSCTQLTSFAVPATVTSIGQFAFYFCEKLQELTFPENSELEMIERHAFDSCTSLRVIDFPDSLKELRIRAFYNCTSLRFAYLPDGVTFVNNSGGTETDYFNSGMLLIFKSKEAYEHSVAQPNFSGPNYLSYLVKVNLYVGGEKESTVEKLYGYDYSYSRVPFGVDKNGWATDLSLTDLPVQQANSYRATAWYKTEELTERADLDYVNGLLKSEEMPAEINLYAHEAVERPADAGMAFPFTGSNTYPANDKATVEALFGVRLHSAITLVSTEYAGEGEPEYITTVGTYTMHLALDRAYGEWDRSASFSVTVARKENSWKVVPNIQGWTEGETENAPTGGVDIYDKQAVFSYEKKDGTALTGKPQQAGEYVLVATVTTGEEVLTARVPFAITEPKGNDYTLNGWKTVPAISGWTEGKTANAPVGGVDIYENQAVFSYETKDGTALSEKPQQAGEYVLVATATSEAGELVARIPFTIAKPASGELIQYILIGGCGVLLIVVIIFAVLLLKRPKKKPAKAPVAAKAAKPEPVKPEPKRESVRQDPPKEEPVKAPEPIASFDTEKNPAAPAKEPVPVKAPTAPAKEPVPVKAPTAPIKEPVPVKAPTAPAKEPVPVKAPTVPAKEPVPVKAPEKEQGKEG